MSGDPAFDNGIPVLTEVFREVFRDKAPLAASVPAPAAEPAPEDGDGGDPGPGPVPALETHALASPAAPDWPLLERRLAERILAQLQDRVEGVLEQRLREGVEAALQHALAGLQQGIEQIVVHAVAQELAQQRTPEQH